MNLFPCPSCEGPEMVVPRDLSDAALVRCAWCGATLGSWEAFRRFCAGVVARDAAASGRPPVSGDPIALPQGMGR